MFGLNLQGKIGSIDSTARSDDGAIIRRDTISLHFEFNSEFASALNGDAKQIQKLLSDGSLERAQMLVDAQSFLVECKDGDDKGVTVTAESARLACKAANKEDAGPQVKMTFCTPTSDDNHLWFLHHLQESVKVRITKQQGDLPGVE